MWLCWVQCCKIQRETIGTVETTKGVFISRLRGARGGMKMPLKAELSLHIYRNPKHVWIAVRLASTLLPGTQRLLATKRPKALQPFDG